MTFAPLHDVDIGIRRLGTKAAITDRGIGHRTAEHLIRSEERDRRAREIEIVHRVSIRHANVFQGGQKAVAAARYVMQVNERNVEGRGDRSQKVAPGLVVRTSDIKSYDTAIAPML